MGLFVIAAYRPKPGMDQELAQCVRDHLPILRQQWLVTDRQGCAMRAKDGTILEVFEWKSAQAVQQAHSNPAVLALWERFKSCSDSVRLADLPEAGEMFANFEPFDVPHHLNFQGSSAAWSAVD